MYAPGLQFGSFGRIPYTYSAYGWMTFVQVVESTVIQFLSVAFSSGVMAYFQIMTAADQHRRSGLFLGSPLAQSDGKHSTSVAHICSHASCQVKLS